MDTKNPLTVKWKTTYTGGLSIPIGFKYGPPLTYVKPVKITESRTCTDGESIYNDVDIVILLEQTSAMKYRYVMCYYYRSDLKDLCMKIIEVAEAMWKLTGSPKLTIYKILETYGNPAPR